MPMCSLVSSTTLRRAVAKGSAYIFLLCTLWTLHDCLALFFGSSQNNPWLNGSQLIVFGRAVRWAEERAHSIIRSTKPPPGLTTIASNLLMFVTGPLSLTLARNLTTTLMITRNPNRHLNYNRRPFHCLNFSTYNSPSHTKGVQYIVR